MHVRDCTLLGVLLVRLVSSSSSFSGRSSSSAHELPLSDQSLQLEQLDARLVRLEQRERVFEAEMDTRISDLERVMPKEFELLHYNVLADQMGINMLPWFCYGADLTPEERCELTHRFYLSGDANKLLPDKGWPKWAEGVLSPERIAAVEVYHRRFFAWHARCARLWEAVSAHVVGCRARSPDIVTLSECDHYEDFWKERFESAGFRTLWRKRPRPSARDGSAIAWRDSTFELIAEGGVMFVTSMRIELM